MEFDASDWPSVPDQAVLRQLDVAATCGICHGPHSTPLSLPCGHSFCAECIRSNIEFQERSAPSRCPHCRERCDTRELRPNNALQGLVQAYNAARLLLTRLASGSASKPPARQHSKPKGYQTRSKEVSRPLQGNNARARSTPKAASAPVKRRRNEASSSSSSEQSGDHPSSHSQSAVESDYRPSQPAGAVESEGGSSDIDEPGDGEGIPAPKRHRASSAQAASPAPHQQPEPAARPDAREASGAYLTCPNCSASIPSAVINDHLDRCLEGAATVGSIAAPKPYSSRQGQASTAAPALQVPPKMAMSLLKDKDLKQKLKQYSLPVTGRRQELEQRYGRFRVAVQTALDRGETQVSYAEVARRLVARDKQAATAGLPSQVLPKAPRNGATRTDSGNGFSELIQATKARSARQSTPVLHDLTGAEPEEGDVQPQQPAGKSEAPSRQMSAAQVNGHATPASATASAKEALGPNQREQPTPNGSFLPSVGKPEAAASWKLNGGPSEQQIFTAQDDVAVVEDSDIEVE